MTDNYNDRKTRASAWFRSLRDEIVAAFEALEDTQTGDLPAGRFEVTETKRHSDDGQDAGGGLMSVMRGGRVFEKVGVNVSTVYGQLGPRAQGGAFQIKEPSSGGSKDHHAAAKDVWVKVVSEHVGRGNHIEVTLFPRWQGGKANPQPAIGIRWNGQGAQLPLHHDGVDPVLVKANHLPP